MTKFERAWRKAAESTKEKQKDENYFIGFFLSAMTYEKPQKYEELVTLFIEATSDWHLKNLDV